MASARRPAAPTRTAGGLRPACAVRMVAEVRPDYASVWPAILAVVGKLGIGSGETLRKWVRQAEVDAGQRPGISSEEAAEVRRLKREVAELRRRMRWLTG